MLNLDRETEIERRNYGTDRIIAIKDGRITCRVDSHDINIHMPASLKELDAVRAENKAAQATVHGALPANKYKMLCSAWNLIERALWKAGARDPEMAPVVKQAPIKLWTLTLNDETESYTSVYTSHDKAEESLYRFVRENWNDFADGDPIPEDIEDAKDTFFADSYDHSYTLDYTTLNPLDQ